MADMAARMDLGPARMKSMPMSSAPGRTIRAVNSQLDWSFETVVHVALRIHSDFQSDCGRLGAMAAWRPCARAGRDEAEQDGQHARRVVPGHQDNEYVTKARHVVLP